jgi:NOL1/NOP2/fmu family ribosome biogenesis protein
MERLRGKKEKEVRKALEEYGIAIKNLLLYSRDNSIYVLTPEAAELLKQVQVKCLAGFYLARAEKAGLRLSFDACQLFAKQIKKYIKLNEKQLGAWFRGEDISDEKARGLFGFFVLKHSEDFVGCGLVKDGKIKNYVPKDRRIK